MKQTGLLFEVRPSDFKTGALAVDEVMPSMDWRGFLPVNEKQYDYSFDTMSCATFSALNVIETWLNYRLLSGELGGMELELLKELGIYKDGNFNFSDRFTAIMSGTTRNGNYFQNVWDSIRHDGLLAEGDLPFSGSTWEEYHDKTKITEEMKEKAKRVLEVLDIGYEWATLIPNANIGVHLKHAPLQGGIPFPATHAVLLPTPNYIFDTYEPFLYERDKDVHFSMKAVVRIKKLPVNQREMYKPKNFALKELVSSDILGKFGDKAWEFLDERLLRNLQWVRDNLGPVLVNYGAANYRCFDEGGYRKNGTSQHNHGRAVDFTVKDMTAQQVREWIIKNQKDAPEPNMWLEDEVNWVHMDVRYSDKAGVYLFKP